MTEAAETAEPTRVTAEEVQTQLARGHRVIFIDVRNQKDWESSKEKLPGAIRVDFAQLADSLKEIHRSRTIVTY